MSAETVSDGRVVAIHYTLRDDAGTVIDQSHEEPLWYLHGHGNIVAGLESQLVGRSVGDQLVAVVAPADGYGELREGMTESVHRSQFPKEMELAEGMPLRAQGSDGRMMILWVEKIQGAHVTVTANHPLAGKTLHFDVRIDAIRDATENELAHGHAHGPDGHAHHH